MKKKPNLNIEINEEEDVSNQHVVIKPNNIINDQLNANSVSETCLDDLITHKNVMESFRKYQ